MKANKELLESIGLQVGVTVVLVVVGLALLSMLGFPSQKLTDLGNLLGIRLIENQATGAGFTAKDTNVTTQVELFEPEADVSLLLPPFVYGLAGKDYKLQYENVILSQDSEQFRFSVSCGTCEQISQYMRRSWKVGDLKFGTHPIFMSVSSLDLSTNYGTAATELRVSEATKLSGANPNILILGDSITRQHWWVNDLARSLNGYGVDNWNMLGRIHEDGSPPFSEKPIEGVRHEAEYGWSLSSFASFIATDDNQAKAYRRDRSPFVFGAGPSDAKLDVDRYYKEQASGNSADYVVIQGGINDIWGVNTDDEVLLKQRIDVTIANAEKLVAAFHAADSNTQVGIILPAPFTRNRKDFRDAYGDSISWWSARRAQHALVKAMIEKFGNRETEGVWLVPLYASFDILDGYPIDNAGHPNRYGQKQIADAVFAWMAWVADQR